MMTIRVFGSLYELLLRLYPRHFRDEFAREMRAVFSESLDQAAKQGILALVGVGLRELIDAPLTLMRVHWFNWKKKGKATSGSTARFPPVPSSSLPLPSPDGHESWMQAGLEISLFLSMGVVLALQTYFPLTWPACGPADRPVSGPLRGMGSINTAILLLPALGFLVGLARGLPRWAYPFGGILLGYGFLAAIRFDMLSFLIASLLAFVVLAIAAAVVNARVRPLPPLLRRLGQSMGLDWTRLSFCIYGVMPLMITTAFDDARCNNRTPYLVISVLLMVAGALAYIRSRRTVLQITALLGGMSLSLWCALLDQSHFIGGLESWLSSPGSWLAEIGWMLKLWANVTALILAPFLIRLAHRALAPGSAA